MASAFFDDVSASTRAACRSSLRGWWRWCAAAGRTPWPAQPDDVAAYVAELLDSGARLLGVRRRVWTMLGGAHRRAGLPDPAAAPAVQMRLWPGGSPSKRSRLSAPEEAEIDVAAAFFDDMSASTQGFYRRSLHGWWRWCAGGGSTPWPAQPDDVAAYVAELLDSGASLRNVRPRIAGALGGAHRRAGLADPTASTAVQALLRPGGAPRRWGRLSAPEEVEIDAALAFFDDVSASTRAVYRSSLRGWWRWCAGAGRTPWPAQPDDVAAYVAELLDSGTSRLGVRPSRLDDARGCASARRAGGPDRCAGRASAALGPAALRVQCIESNCCRTPRSLHHNSVTQFCALSLWRAAPGAPRVSEATVPWGRPARSPRRPRGCCRRSRSVRTERVAHS